MTDTISGLGNATSIARRFRYEHLIGLPEELLEILPAAVSICDAQGVIVRYNRRAAEIWGRAPQLGDTEERFRASYRLYHLDGRPLTYTEAAMAEVLATGMPVQDREFVIERPDRSRVVVLVNIAPLRDSNGGLRGAINCFQDITERKRAERQLRRSREELEDFFENAPVALHWVGPDGVILRANQAELDLLGYAREDYIGHHISAFHAEPAVIEDILSRLSRGEQLDTYPARLRAKDGSIKDVLISSNVRFEDGRFAHTRCFTIDVTERKRTEARLRDSEARLRTFAEAIPDLIWALDADGSCHYLSRAWQDYVSVTDGPQDITGWLDAIHPEDRPQWEAFWANAGSTSPSSYEIEYRLRRSDGAYRWFRSRSVPLHGPDGQFVRWVGACTDITQIRQTEERLRDSQERLSSALLASDTGTFRWKIQDNLLEWDEGLRRIFMLPSDAKVRQIEDFLALLHPDDRGPLAADIEQAIRSRTDFARDFRIVRPDGSVRWVSEKARVLFDAQNRPLHLTGACRDVTEHKQAEEHQQLLMAELSHRVKNTLAVVKSIAAQTLRRAASLDGFATSFSGRLSALAGAHNLLTEQNWRSAHLAKLVYHALKAHGVTKQAVNLSGVDLELPPRQALTLSLVFHELATNAAKHGALSVQTGRLDVSWALEMDTDGTRLRFQWVERDGPPVAPPSAAGFGTTLIRRTIAHDLDGAVELAFQPDGLRCVITLPWGIPPRSEQLPEGHSSAMAGGA